MEIITLNSKRRNEFIDITSFAQEAVTNAPVEKGFARGLSGSAIGSRICLREV